MKTSRIFLACMVLLASSASLADASSEFSVLLDDHWEWCYSQEPVPFDELQIRAMFAELRRRNREKIAAAV